MKTDDDDDEWFFPTKYRGECLYCGGDVPPGQGEYQRSERGGWQIRHAGGNCPKDPSLEQIRAEAERRGLTVLSKGTVRVWQRIGSKRISGGRSAPDLTTAPRPGSILRVGDKTYMVVRLIRTFYLSRYDLEDEDLDSSERPGWRGDFSAVEVAESTEPMEPTESMESLRVVDKGKHGEKETKSTKEETAKAEEGFEAKWRGIMTPPEGWTMLDITGRVMLPEESEWIQIDTLEQRDENGQIVRYAYMYIVRPYIVVRHGTPGDDRVTIMIPPDLVDDYMRALGGP